MTTFSSLPTSHFTLKPSSSDTEMDESPMSYWNQSGSMDWVGTDSYSWSWNHPFTGLGNEKQWHRSFSGIGNSRTNTGSFYPHSASNNYGPSYRSTAALRQKSNQQVQNDNHATTTGVKDVSRSSLSVTDSKTIVLTNTPALPQQQGVSGSDKKKENKSLQNHKLNGGNGMLKKWSNLSADKSAKKTLQDGTNPAVDPRLAGATGGDAGTARTKSVDELKSGAANPVGEGGNIGGMVNGQEGAAGEVDKNKEGVLADRNSTKPQGESEKEGQLKLSNEPKGGVVKPKLVSDQNSTSPASTSAIPSKPVKSKPSITVKQLPPTESVDVDIWSVNGPGSKILSLSSFSQRGKTRIKRLQRKPTASVSVESAKGIASKFGIKVPPKRSDGTILGSSSVGDLSVGHTGQSPAGVLLHSSSSASSRSGSSTPTILNSLEGALAQQKLGALGTAMAAGLSGVKVTVPSAAKTGETSIISGANVASGSSSSASVDGAGAGDQKRTTNANSISDGIVGHVTSQVDHVTASVGTNGTNFQEMFNSSKRKLSESTERGLKQALAG